MGYQEVNAMLFESILKHGNREMVEELFENLGVFFGKARFLEPNVNKNVNKRSIGVMTEHGISNIVFFPPRSYTIFLFPLTLNTITLHRRKELLKDRVNVDVIIEPLEIVEQRTSIIVPGYVFYRFLSLLRKKRRGTRKLVEDIARHRRMVEEKEVEDLVRKLLVEKLGIQHEYDTSYNYYLKHIEKEGYKRVGSLIIDYGYNGMLFERIIVRMPEKIMVEPPYTRIFFERSIDHELKINIKPISFVDVTLT